MRIYQIMGICRMWEETRHAPTTDEVDWLMDEIRVLSISDREWLLNGYPLLPGAVYTALSQHDAEMGGLTRY